MLVVIASLLKLQLSAYFPTRKKLPGNNQVVSTAEKIPLILFIFNSCRRLARHVVQYAVNLLDFVNDPHGDLLQDIPWDLGKVSRHPVN